MNTRFNILEYLRQHPGSTVRELSQVLQVTPADIRHHLKSLQSDNLIESFSRNDAYARGRPAQGFRLSANQASMALNNILLSVLCESLSELDQKAQRDFIARVCDRIASKSSPQRSMSQKLVQLVQQLTNLGFSARWEARAESPQIILEGFPYLIDSSSRQIYLQFTEILLERMLDASVRYLPDQRDKHPSETVYRFSVR